MIVQRDISNPNQFKMFSNGLYRNGVHQNYICRADLQNIADLTFIMIKLNYDSNVVVLFPYVLRCLIKEYVSILLHPTFKRDSPKNIRFWSPKQLIVVNLHFFVIRSEDFLLDTLQRYLQ